MSSAQRSSLRYRRLTSASPAMTRKRCRSRGFEMTCRIMLVAVALYLSIVGALSVDHANAQPRYPDKPIKLIVPYTPGTGIDILARTLAQKIGDDWKVGVVVDNRPGASGNIGTEAVAKSAPDGYTLLTTASTIVINRSLFKSIPYDPVKDFVPVAPLAIGRLALVTHPSVDAKTAKEFIAYAKANPGKLFYGSPGNGTPHHLAMEMFKSATGID